MTLDVFSRKIVGHEVHDAESAELAALLMRRASLAEGLAGRRLVLHSDNGSSAALMKRGPGRSSSCVGTTMSTNTAA